MLFGSLAISFCFTVDKCKWMIGLWLNSRKIKFGFYLKKKRIESRMTPRFWVNCVATEMRKKKFKIKEKRKLKFIFEYVF